MSHSEVAENNVAADTQRASSAYVPTLQRTARQPPPIAATCAPRSRGSDASSPEALPLQAGARCTMRVRPSPCIA